MASVVARSLENVELEELDAGRRRLGTLWADRPVVLAFIRHFG